MIPYIKKIMPYITYIVIGVIFLIFLACGIRQLHASLTLLCFSVSLLLVFLGITLVYFAPIYQRKQYAKQLHNKQRAIKEKPPISFKNHKFLDFCFRRRIVPTQKQLFFLAFILSIVLVLFPFANWSGLSGVLDFFTIIRRTMQTFVVDGDISDFIQNDLGRDNLPIMLQTVSDEGIIFYNIYTAILCIAAGLLFAFNILGIFAKEFYAYCDYWFMHPLSDIYVMSELNEKSITLAESIFLSRHRFSKDTKNNGISQDTKENASNENIRTNFLRIYFCDVYSDNKEGISELIYRAKKLGAVVMKKDITEIKIKKCAKSNTFYLIGEKEEKNVEQAQQLCASYNRKKIKRSLEIYVYASRIESELIIDDINGQL